jgi:hypothetical protein
LNDTSKLNGRRGKKTGTASIAAAPEGDTIADKATTKRKAAGVGNFRMGNQPPAGRINSPGNDVVDDIAPASFNSKATFLSAGQAADLPKASPHNS